MTFLYRMISLFVWLLLAVSCTSTLNMQEFYDKAKRAYDFNEFEDAIAYFSKVISLSNITDNPEELPKVKGLQARAYAYRGNSYFKRKKYELAIEDYHNAISLIPDDPYFYQWRASCYFNVGLFDRALEDCDKALKIAPNHLGARIVKGIIYNEMGSNDLSIENFEVALKQDLEYCKNYANIIVVAFINRGLKNYNVGKFEDALSDFNHATSMFPNFADLYIFRAASYFRMKKTPQALENINLAIQKDPENGVYYYWRGRIHYNLGLYDSAIQDLSIAMNKPVDVHTNWQDGFNLGNAYFLRGLSYEKKEDITNARRDFKRAIELGNKEVEEKIGKYDLDEEDFNMGEGSPNYGGERPYRNYEGDYSGYSIDRLRRNINRDYE